jgi:hypothetical protein
MEQTEAIVISEVSEQQQVEVEAALMQVEEIVAVLEEEVIMEIPVGQEQPVKELMVEMGMPPPMR